MVCIIVTASIFTPNFRRPYGKYSTYFAPPPAVGCLPPPREQMVPCPHNSRHIVVSAATTRMTFGHQFAEEFEDATKMEVQRQHKIFALLREGYEALFHLRPDDAKYLAQRTESLYAESSKNGGLNIGLHVRHGDMHPWEYQYSKDYIPLDRYIDTARDMINGQNSGWSKSRKSKPVKKNTDNLSQYASSKIILASDDPDVYENAEMSQTTRAQDHIILATKKKLEAASGKKNPWVDEISGWEGGFYRDVFWSLGRPVGNRFDVDHLDNNEAPEGAMKLRELVGRAYLLDLAVLGKSDAVVCTVSATGCRILAVMLGWESAINQGNWRNIDGDFDWKGIIW